MPLTWRDAAGYFERLEAAGPAVNVASLVPNGQLRLAVVGLEDRPASRDELAAMRGLLEESLEQGAWGFSTGLEYAAERAASPDELGSLCAVCARSGGLYATHTRYRDVGSEDAVDEAIETAERAGVRLQVSHLVPRNGIDATRACIDRVERAAGRGLDIAFDMHTRLFGTTFLSTAVPPAFLRSDRIGSPDGRREAVEAMASYTSILSAGDDWSRIVLLDNDLWPEYARRDLAAIAADRRQTAPEAICDLLAAAPDALGTLMVIIHCYTEDQQAEAFHHPLCAPGSDATTLAPDGPLATSFFHGAYTWAAWYLRFMVRERALLSLEEAVKRLTSDPAERVGLRDRGVLRVGAFADVAVLDSAAVRETGTTFEPNQLATGVRHVLVNGRAGADRRCPDGAPRRHGPPPLERLDEIDERPLERLAHDRLGAGAVTCDACVVERLHVRQRAREPVGVGEVHVVVAAGQVVERDDAGKEPRATRGPVDDRPELPGRVQVPVAVERVRHGAHRVEVARHLGQVVVGQVLGAVKRQEGLQARPGQQDLLELLDAQRGDARPGVRPQLDEPLPGELLERDAHGRDADAELLGELPVAEPCPRCERAVEDRAPEPSHDHLLHRALLPDAHHVRHLVRVRRHRAEVSPARPSERRTRSSPGPSTMDASRA